MKFLCGRKKIYVSHSPNIFFSFSRLAVTIPPKKEATKYVAPTSTFREESFNFIVSINNADIKIITTDEIIAVTIPLSTPLILCNPTPQIPNHFIYYIPSLFLYAWFIQDSLVQIMVIKCEKPTFPHLSRRVYNKKRDIMSLFYE